MFISTSPDCFPKLLGIIKKRAEMLAMVTEAFWLPPAVLKKRWASASRNRIGEPVNAAQEAVGRCRCRTPLVNSQLPDSLLKMVAFFSLISRPALQQP